MALIASVVLLGTGVFCVGIVTRKRKIILFGAPAALLLLIWFVSASSSPNPEREFDRLFGAGNRDVASDVQTIKPTFMDGHFICFRMGPADFRRRLRPQFSEVELTPRPNILLGQRLPTGWPAAIEAITSVLHREVERNDVYLLYFPDQERAYASVSYEQW